MDIRELQYFKVIAETGQITAASQKLNISQPPLSRQLKLLEDELGFLLFHRKAKQLELTKEGKLFLEHVNSLLEYYNSTIHSIDEIKEGKIGSLSIGTICSASMSFLPGSIQKFLSLYPAVSFHIYEASSSSILQLMDEGVVEIGIVKEPYDHQLYNHVYIDNDAHDDRFTAVGLHDFFQGMPENLSLSDLKKSPLIVHKIYKQTLQENCNLLDFEPNIVCSNDNIMTALALAIAGIGIAVVPYNSSHLISSLAHGNALEVRTLSDPMFSTRTALIWKKQNVLSFTANNFIRQVQETYS